MDSPPALSIVVYRYPGPGDNEIASHSRGIFAALARLKFELELELEPDSECSGEPDIGQVGYVTLHEADFDKVWNGVSRGEGLPAACGVISLLGPKTRQYIVNPKAFTFGWTSHQDKKYGETLLLRVYPRNPLSTPWN